MNSDSFGKWDVKLYDLQLLTGWDNSRFNPTEKIVCGVGIAHKRAKYLTWFSNFVMLTIYENIRLLVTIFFRCRLWRIILALLKMVCSCQHRVEICTLFLIVPFAFQVKHIFENGVGTPSPGSATQQPNNMVWPQVCLLLCLTLQFHKHFRDTSHFGLSVNLTQVYGARLWTKGYRFLLEVVSFECIVCISTQRAKP